MRAVITPQLSPLAAPIENLTLDPDNARVGDVAAIRRSLNVFGQRKPVVVRQTGTDADGQPTGIVVAGNHTLRAAIELGWDHVAAVFVADDATMSKAYALADNHIGELATWDEDRLAATLRELDGESFDLESLGWPNDELAALLSGATSAGSDGDGEDIDDDELADPPADPVTRPGDVWLIGPHRIMCGDSREQADVDALIGTTSINVAVTSPPYASQRTYDESSGFLPIKPDEYVDWFDGVQANVRRHLADDGSWFVNIKPHAVELDTDLYVFDLVTAHVRRWGWHFATEFCWERVGIPMTVSRRFKNQFEPVYHFAAGDWKFRPDAVRHPTERLPGNGVPPDGARLQRNGTSRTRSLVQGTNTDTGEFLTGGLAYPGNRLPCLTGSYEAVGHSAAFPVGLPSFFINAYSDPGDAVYDPFLGSGSTLIAAHQCDRVGFGIEISAAYVDMACRRIQRSTGIVPILESTGEPHDFMGGAPR